MVARPLRQTGLVEDRKFPENSAHRHAGRPITPVILRASQSSTVLTPEGTRPTARLPEIADCGLYSARRMTSMVCSADPLDQVHRHAFDGFFRRIWPGHHCHAESVAWRLPDVPVRAGVGRTSLGQANFSKAIKLFGSGRPRRLIVMASMICQIGRLSGCARHDGVDNTS
jgi:hypothetical protein